MDEQEFVSNAQSRPKCELAVQDFSRARIELNQSILARLRIIAIDAVDARLRDKDRPCPNVVVANGERNLFRRTQSSEKPELIEIALRFAPVAVEGSNQQLGVVNPKGVGSRPLTRR